MKELGNVVANLAQGRKEELLSHFFKLMHLTGLTAEALKFGVTGDFAPKSGTQLKVQTGVPHVAGSANGGDAGPTENGKLNLIVSENAECPVKRRFGGGQLKPFTSSYFSDRNRLFSERLLPEVYRHALDGGDNTYETLLQQPEYGKFDERTIEYSWILRQFAQLEPILKHNVLDVGCVLNNKLIAGYIGNIFDMIWFMNPAPEPLAYDDGVAYIVSDVRAHRLPSGMQFDVVTCLSTLEHIGMDTERYGGPGGEINPYPDQPQRNAVEAVRAMYQLLAPGGVMYLSVPYGPFEYLYDYGGGLPIYYTFDQARLEELLSYIPESEAEISVEIYKVAPGVGWVKTTRDDRTILKHADGCAAAGGGAMVKIVRPPQQLPSKPVDERALRIAVCASNSTTGYSGGRYHAWMIAEALAHVGHEVIIWTDNIPAFRKDFSMFRHDQSLDIQHSPAYRNLPVGPVDVVILVPQLHNRHHFFAKTLYLAAKHKARLVLLNFETPNWFNALSPEPRKSALWDGWLGASQAADMILSLTQEGTHYARDFYTNTVDGVLFRHCYPTINTYAVNAVGRVTRERQIICSTRFGRGSKHKGANELLKAIGPATSGYTLAIIVGTGQIESKTRKALEEKARRFNVEIRLLHQLSDQEKFREIKRSKLMLFLSFFEGYGIPIVESLYCDTPCIVYDLPVLQEVGGEGLIYVSPGDEEELQKAIRRVLSGEYNPPVHLSEHIAPLAQFEDFAQRLEVLMQELTALPTEPAVTRIPAALRRQWGSHFFIPLLNLSKQSQQPGADKAKASALRLPSPPEHVGLRQLPAPLNILRKFYHRLVPLQIRLRLRDMRRQAISSSRKLYHQYVPLHLRLRFRDMRHGWLEFLRTGYHAVIPLKTRLFLRNVRVRLIGR